VTSLAPTYTKNIFGTEPEPGPGLNTTNYIPFINMKATNVIPFINMKATNVIPVITTKPAHIESNEVSDYSNIAHLIEIEKPVSEFDKRSASLQNYLTLPEDWDGYGGVAPGIEAVTSCMELLSKLDDLSLTSVLPKTMLSGNGEVSLYWTDKETGLHIEIGSEEEGLFSYLVSSKDVVFGEDDIDLNNIEIPNELAKHISYLSASRN